MSHRPLKIGKGETKAVAPQEKANVSRTKLSNNSFNKIFAASFKRMDDMQESFRKLDEMHITFRKDLFSPAPLASPSPIQSATAQIAPESGFKDIVKMVMKHEGTAYVRKDGGRESSKMGILQSTARSYGYKGDIRNISKSEAEAIYKKLWDKSGAAKLPYPLSAVHFDTYINSPAAARKILSQSGGDVDAYLKMREDRFVRLASMRPATYGKYLSGWMNRIASLRSIAADYSNMTDSEKTRIASSEKSKSHV